MGCRIFIGREEGASYEQAVLFCSTTDWAFGPVINEHGELSASEVAEKFIEWLPSDPRTYADNVLEGKYCDFRKELEAEVDDETTA